MKDYVFLECTQNYSYPEANNDFSPSMCYPEYPWGENHLSKEENHIYDMVRNLLFKMELDADNFGKPEWNPLGSIISLGNTVLLKPNMVMHIHPKGEDINSVITHPSVVRAVADYVYIALKGTGKLIIGDSPLQGCDFSHLVHNMGYVKIVDFYSDLGLNIELSDLRLSKADKIISNDSHPNVNFNEDPEGYKSVDLAHKSMLNSVAHKFSKFRIASFDKEPLLTHHNLSKHEYMIAGSILKADVIINMPKPKTHKRAGITASLKNLIGINGFKDWLPHHTKGSFSEGGDEYPEKSILKKMSISLTEKFELLYIKNEKKLLAEIYYRISRMLEYLQKKLNLDTIIEGSWYGNDTIWRTICDLNRILFYCDKNGVMQSTKQRKYMIIADMVLTGEGEGPITPSPKKAGIIAGGFDPVVFDASIAAIMGFDYKKIPSVFNSFSIKDYPITGVEPKDIIIKSDNAIWNNKSLEDFNPEDSLKFVPSIGWLQHIEL